MIGMARMGRRSMSFEAQEQIVARNHPPSLFPFRCRYHRTYHGRLKVGNIICVQGKLGRIKVTKEVREYDQPFVPGARPFTHGLNLLA